MPTILKITVLIAIGGVAAASASEANFCGRDQPHPIDVRFAQSVTKAAGVTVSIRAAQSEAYEKWDKELNDAYRALASKLQDGDKQTLLESQRAWLKYRDAESKFLWSQSMFGGEGTIGTVVVADRMRDVLKARVCDLQNSLKYLSIQ